MGGVPGPRFMGGITSGGGNKTNFKKIPSPAKTKIMTIEDTMYIEYFLVSKNFGTSNAVFNRNITKKKKIRIISINRLPQSKLLLARCVKNGMEKMPNHSTPTRRNSNKWMLVFLFILLFFIRATPSLLLHYYLIKIHVH
jgi:hypothetical protein